MTEKDASRKGYGLYDGRCVAGCKHYHGGEIKHHLDCGHYPDSLTKVNADKIASLLARAEKAEAERDQALARLAAVEHLGADKRAANLNAEALSEIKATLDGSSEQSVQEIMDGLILELRTLPPRALTSADAKAALQRVVDAVWNEAVEAAARVQDIAHQEGANAAGQHHAILALKRPEASHDQ